MIIKIILKLKYSAILPIYDIRILFIILNNKKFTYSNSKLFCLLSYKIFRILVISYLSSYTIRLEELLEFENFKLDV